MHYIELKEDRIRRLSFYLAMEEYVARYIYEDVDCFFMWQVRPTVICGRNQVVENEVNLDYCREHGIQVYRRKSGGGCVYADMGNVMLSYITCEENLTEAFSRYLKLFTEALNSMNIPAQRNDHNDVMLFGQKISGNAIWHLPGKTIAHGTLLYDTMMENMTQAITPPKQKLEKNGVQSVRQRITLLKDITPLSLEEIKARLRSHICDDTITLDSHAVEMIEEIEKEYLAKAYLYPKEEN